MLLLRLVADPRLRLAGYLDAESARYRSTPSSERTRAVAEAWHSVIGFAHSGGRSGSHSSWIRDGERNMPSSSTPNVPLEEVAGNGLLHRRLFLTQGIALIGAGGLTVLPAASAAAPDPPSIPPWMRAPGAGMSGYGTPAK